MSRDIYQYITTLIRYHRQKRFKAKHWLDMIENSILTTSCRPAGSPGLVRFAIIAVWFGFHTTLLLAPFSIGKINPRFHCSWRAAAAAASLFQREKFVQPCLHICHLCSDNFPFSRSQSDMYGREAACIMFRLLKTAAPILSHPSQFLPNSFSL